MMATRRQFARRKASQRSYAYPRIKSNRTIDLITQESLRALGGTLKVRIPERYKARTDGGWLA